MNRIILDTKIEFPPQARFTFSSPPIIGDIIYFIPDSPLRDLYREPLKVVNVSIRTAFGLEVHEITFRDMNDNTHACLINQLSPHPKASTYLNE